MKHLIIVCDGLTDQPVAEKDNKSPLQLAATPNLDRLARGGRCGSVQTIPDSLHAGGDVSYMALLGYDPESCCGGPARLACLSLGIELKDGEEPLFCDFVSLQSSHNDMVMKDFTAGHLKSEPAAVLLDALNEGVVYDGNRSIKFYPGAGYHNIMVLESPPIQGRLNPPNELIGEGIRQFMPTDDACKDLVYILNQAQIILHNHPFNRQRRKETKDLVNSIWMWGNGKATDLIPFAEKFGSAAALISGSLVFKGTAAAAGVKVVPVEGATGFTDTDYNGKVRAALEELENRDIVYLHIGAPEDVSLHGNIEEVLLALEDFDRQIIGPVLDHLENRNDVKILLVGSHVSSVVLMKYSKEPVPYVVYPSEKGADATQVFDEEILYSEAKHFGAGPDLIESFIKGEL